METPDLRHFRDGGVFSDPALALVGESWVEAVYTDRGWFTIDLATKLDAVTEWTHGQKADQGRKEDRQGDERVQGRNTEKRQTRSRQRSGCQKP